jgi:hypothetical protein
MTPEKMPFAQVKCLSRNGWYLDSIPDIRYYQKVNRWELHLAKGSQSSFRRRGALFY